MFQFVVVGSGRVLTGWPQFHWPQFHSDWPQFSLLIIPVWPNFADEVIREGRFCTAALAFFEITYIRLIYVDIQWCTFHFIAATFHSGTFAEQDACSQLLSEAEESTRRRHHERAVSLFSFTSISISFIWVIFYEFPRLVGQAKH